MRQLNCNWHEDWGILVLHSPVAAQSWDNTGLFQLRSFYLYQSCSNRIWGLNFNLGQQPERINGSPKTVPQTTTNKHKICIIRSWLCANSASGGVTQCSVPLSDLGCEASPSRWRWCGAAELYMRSAPASHWSSYWRLLLKCVTATNCMCTEEEGASSTSVLVQNICGCC